MCATCDPRVCTEFEPGLAVAFYDPTYLIGEDGRDVGGYVGYGISRHTEDGELWIDTVPEAGGAPSDPETWTRRLLEDVFHGDECRDCHRQFGEYVAMANTIGYESFPEPHERARTAAAAELRSALVVLLQDQRDQPTNARVLAAVDAHGQVAVHAAVSLLQAEQTRRGADHAPATAPAAIPAGVR